MNIDWDCEDAKGKGYCLINSVSGTRAVSFSKTDWKNLAILSMNAVDAGFKVLDGEN